VSRADPARLPTITVGVAALNAAPTLPRLLDSLLAQQYPRDYLDIVIADNGSTDETAEIARRYAERGPVRLVAATHRRGPAVARNAIVESATGEIIAFTDADCVAHERWLAEIAGGFDDPAVGCVAGAILPAESRTAAERFYAQRNVLSQDFVLAHPFLPYAQTANAAFRREVFERIGLFDEVMITCEDADLLWRMQLETDLRLCYRPEALIWHRHRSTERALLKQTIGWGLGQALVYRKYRRRMARDPWRRLLVDYRRIAGLASLCVQRWIGLRVGTRAAEELEEAYVGLLFYSGMKIGRLKGSLRARVFYP